MSRVSRRQFIAAGTAATGAAIFAAPRQAIAQEKVDFGDFRVGIQSNVLNAFSPELEPMLGHIADLGLRWVEFANWHYEVTDDEARIAEVQALLARHSIGMEAYFLGEIEAGAVVRSEADLQAADVEVLQAFQRRLQLGARRPSTSTLAPA